MNLCGTGSIDFLDVHVFTGHFHRFFSRGNIAVSVKTSACQALDQAHAGGDFTYQAKAGARVQFFEDVFLGF